MPDYSQGKVYKIVNSANDVIYIGSTCQPLSSRMTGHRYFARSGKTQAMYCAMRELGIKKFRIILIEDFACMSKSQLEAREFMQMRDAQIMGTQLYNHMVDGHHSNETREKMSRAQTGKCISSQVREKMSQAKKGKVGEKSNRFKRGSISFRSSHKTWSFHWYENGKLKTQSFSVKKFGDSAAHAFALIFQDEIYPKVEEDDTELIEEIRARNQ